MQLHDDTDHIHGHIAFNSVRVLEKGRNMITEMVIGTKSYSRLSTKSVKSTIWQRWTWIKYVRTERKKRNASGTRVKMVNLVGMI